MEGAGIGGGRSAALRGDVVTAELRLGELLDIEDIVGCWS